MSVILPTCYVYMFGYHHIDMLIFWEEVLNFELVSYLLVNKTIKMKTLPTM